jgi:hypothetical protein
MNEHIEKAIEALEAYYQSQLPKTEIEWLAEIADLKQLPNTELLAIKRARASLGISIVEAMKTFRSSDLN